MAYALKLHRNVEKQLQRIPLKQRKQLIKRMRSLRNDPRPSGCLKLDETLYRIRQGPYRIIYAVFDQAVVVIICKVARRSESTYQNLKKLLNQAKRQLDNH